MHDLFVKSGRALKIERNGPDRAHKGNSKESTYGPIAISAYALDAVQRASAANGHSTMAGIGMVSRTLPACRGSELDDG